MRPAAAYEKNRCHLRTYVAAIAPMRPVCAKLLVGANLEQTGVNDARQDVNYIRYGEGLAYCSIREELSERSPSDTTPQLTEFSAASGRTMPATKFQAPSRKVLVMNECDCV